jgi:nucleotide-binding universal stress UspA family protein
MKSILAFVDLTETAIKTTQQAIDLAKLKGAEVLLCYVFPNRPTEGEVDEKLQPYSKLCADAGVSFKKLEVFGEFFSEAYNTVANYVPDLVVVGTHGKVGLKQTLFGSNIYKLVSKLPCSTLIVSDNTNPSQGGFKNILMPVSAHKNYINKINATINILGSDGKIGIYSLNKPGVGHSDKVISNIKAAKEKLEERNINYTYIESDASKFSIGYSKESINLVEENNGDCISILVNISEEGMAYGKIDKENLMLNNKGIPVLCVN